MEREERGKEVSAKTEVKRYIWLNGHRRATAFYIYRIPVVARFLYRGDKRLSSTTDLFLRRVFSDSNGHESLPFLLRLQIQGKIVGGCFTEKS